MKYIKSCILAAEIPLVERAILGDVFAGDPVRNVGNLRLSALKQPGLGFDKVLFKELEILTETLTHKKIFRHFLTRFLLQSHVKSIDRVNPSFI